MEVGTSKVKSWLTQPELPKPKSTKQLVSVITPGLVLTIIVPGFGVFKVMQPSEGIFRGEFINEICAYLFGAVHYWYVQEENNNDGS